MIQAGVTHSYVLREGYVPIDFKWAVSYRWFSRGGAVPSLATQCWLYELNEPDEFHGVVLNFLRCCLESRVWSVGRVIPNTHTFLVIVWCVL